MVRANKADKISCQLQSPYGKRCTTNKMVGNKLLRRKHHLIKFDDSFKPIQTRMSG